MTTNKIKTVAMLFALATVSSPLFADDYSSQAGDKFSRGLANTVTGWVKYRKILSMKAMIAIYWLA